jgi:uncharacterized protein YjiS (DUF1127 family)
MTPLSNTSVLQSAIGSVRTADLSRRADMNLHRKHARDVLLQQPSRLIGWLKAMRPARVIAALAAYRAEREMQFHLNRLADLSAHLVDDVGVVRKGPPDFVAPM